MTKTRRKPYYECHVTMEGDPAFIRPIVEATGWKFSAIHDDIILGEGLKAYATQHFNIKIPEEEVVEILLGVADKISSAGVEVIRRKVEKVVFDDKKARRKPCTGACVECHLDDYAERCAKVA